MGSRPGSPFALEDKASWMFNFWGFTDSPHPHKRETRGRDTIQATSFFPWWLLLLFQDNSEAKGDLQNIQKSEKNPEKLINFVDISLILIFLATSVENFTWCHRKQSLLS